MGRLLLFVKTEGDVPDVERIMIMTTVGGEYNPNVATVGVNVVDVRVSKKSFKYNTPEFRIQTC